MDAIKRHWDIRSSDYNDFVVKGFSIDRERRSWQEHFTSILGTEPLDILDVGCGPGIVSMQLADLGHRMTSVDLSDRMLEYARENARANGLDMSCRSTYLLRRMRKFVSALDLYYLYHTVNQNRG